MLGHKLPLHVRVSMCIDHLSLGNGDLTIAQDKMLKVEKNNENRSLKTNRLFPTANKPDPMPQNLAFLFTKITPEQMIYMWNVLTASWREAALRSWLFWCNWEFFLFCTVLCDDQGDGNFLIKSSAHFTKYIRHLLFCCFYILFLVLT